jgi:N-acetylneuraminic acid mutarotase
MMSARITRRAFAVGAAAAPLVGAGAAGPAAAAEETGSPAFRRLADLPANRTAWNAAIPVREEYWRQIGLAGMVVGAHGGYLIAAGGANFPEPALTATRANTLGKIYWADAFVMGPDRTWLDGSLSLPDALAYSACVSTADGVVVIGGEGFRGGPNGATRAPVTKFPDVFRLRYDPGAHRLVREDLPDLPRPMSYAVAALIGKKLYVAEGADFYTLDLARPGDGWRTLPAWPGPARSVAVGAAVGGRFYLLSGRAADADGTWHFYRDAYAYDPRTAAWRTLTDLPWCVTAGLAWPVGDGRHLLLAGGDKDLARWNLIQRQTAAGHKDAVTWIYDHHTGFNGELLLYDTHRDRWRVVGDFPGPSQVTTPAVRWGDDLVIVSGEVRPGIRTPAVWAVRP